MTRTSCRITGIEIENFKNVKYGSLKLYSGDKGEDQSSILGLYGQNGSGKTALLDGLVLLKYALTGNPIPSHWSGLINLGAKEARFHFTFSIRNDHEKYRVYYSFSLKREKKEPLGNMNIPPFETQRLWASDSHGLRPVICKESLSLSYRGMDMGEEESMEEGAPLKDSPQLTLHEDALKEDTLRGDPLLEGFEEKDSPGKDSQRKDAQGKELYLRKEKILDTDSAEVFLPRAKYRTLVGPSKTVQEQLLLEKALSARESRSFLFSPVLLQTISKRIQPKMEDGRSDQRVRTAGIWWRAILAMVRFGNLELFIFDARHRDAISIIQPIHQENLLDAPMDGLGGGQAAGLISIPFDAPGLVPNSALEGVKKALSSINTVLPTLIPGMTLEFEELGSQRMMDGQVGTNILLMARRDNLLIPLKDESQGNRKIISILQLLIMVYNEPSVTVAIDELDAGIFEYLLGEILQIISRHGYGQLIFTSHNLRPLEVLDPRFVAFSTTNPSNCYIRFRIPKNAKNLRAFYYRNILLGGQAEELYRSTNNPEIDLALKAAGKRLSSGWTKDADGLFSSDLPDMLKENALKDDALKEDAPFSSDPSKGADDEA